MKSNSTNNALALLKTSAESRLRLYQLALRTLLPHARRDRKPTRRQAAAVILAEGLLKAAA